MAKFKKFIGGILGAVTGGVVIAVLGAAGVDVDPGQAAAIAGALSALGTLLAPKNATS
jgi:hypothetical protein